MKIYCDLHWDNTPPLCFTFNHMFKPFEQLVPITHSQAQLPNETTHYVIFDVRPGLEAIMEGLALLRSAGMKVILFSFDPANFKRIDYFIQKNALSKVVLFDTKFKWRFKIPTYITDYFFHQPLFPKAPDSYELTPCVMGTLSHGRHNNYGHAKVDEPPASSYEELYKRVQGHCGIHVWDTGLDENREHIVYYNKAKSVEALMCGRNAYCHDGINSINYNRYLRHYSEMANPRRVEFAQEKIWEINKKVISDVIYETMNS